MSAPIIRLSLVLLLVSSVAHGNGMFTTAFTKMKACPGSARIVWSGIPTGSLVINGVTQPVSGFFCLQGKSSIDFDIKGAGGGADYDNQPLGGDGGLVRGTFQGPFTGTFQLKVGAGGPSNVPGGEGGGASYLSNGATQGAGAGGGGGYDSLGESFDPVGLAVSVTSHIGNGTPQISSLSDGGFGAAFGVKIGTLTYTDGGGGLGGSEGIPWRLAADGSISLTIN